MTAGARYRTAQVACAVGSTLLFGAAAAFALDVPPAARPLACASPAPAPIPAGPWVVLASYPPAFAPCPAIVRMSRPGRPIDP